MRVSDLARKLGIKTEELRSQLVNFGVGQAEKEINSKTANEIFEALMRQAGSSEADEKEEEEGAELLGMVFDEETEEEAEEKSTKKEKSQGESVETSAPTAKKVSGDQEAARARWARAKKASEKLITRKVKKIEKEKLRRITKQQEKFEEAMKAPTTQTAAAKSKIKIGEMISVRELGEKMGVSPIRIVGELLKNGVMSNLNQTIDFETAAIVAEAFQCKVTKDTTAVSGKEVLKGNITKLLEDDPDKLTERPPIVAVMGHVDHGKTTLLDTIRKTNVVKGEAGGITQHIGAYQVEVPTEEDSKSRMSGAKSGISLKRKITFLDTPGHEAFTTMRARGARATDIAIIVVAADEGVKPQTIEAINHAREAGVPIVVAITKIDKPGANIDKVKGELAEHDLQPSDWGGKTEMVSVAAPTGQGIEELLEIILLTNDIEPVMANPDREAVCTVIESKLDKSLGPIVTVLVNTGTLKLGDNFVIGPVVGRVKKMFNWGKKTVKEALPGMPVLIAGLTELPRQGAGEILQALRTPEAAKKKAAEMQKLLDLADREKQSGMSQIIGRINAGEMKELKIVLKADVEGSLEALRENIGKIGNENVKAKVIHGGVGDVSETDVLMSAAADGLLIAFHTKVPSAVAKLADREGVSIRKHTIIYKVLDEIEKLLSGLLDPEEVETELGELEVRGIFFTKGKEQTVGGGVKTGIMQNGVSVRILRNGKLIDEGRITSLKRDQESVHEVKEGFECGLKIQLGKEKIKEGDIVQAWKVEKKERKL
ncbi:MAG: translation initiation factor IF-2 [Patescibacteria group bacterium]